MKLINRIANNRQPTMSKLKLFNDLVTYINAQDKLDDDTEVFLSKVYNYLLPKLGRKSTCGLDFVKRAVANKNEPREMLRYIMVKDGYIVSVDGFRLTAIENIANYADGFYDTNMVKLDKPNLKPLILDELINHTFTHSKTFKMSDCEVVFDGDTSFKSIQIEGFKFSIKYVTQCANGDDEFEFHYNITNSHSLPAVCKFVNKSYPDVIMIVMSKRSV